MSDQQPPQEPESSGAQGPSEQGPSEQAPAPQQPPAPPPAAPLPPPVQPPQPPAAQPGAQQPYGSPINQQPIGGYPQTPGYGAVAPAAVPQTNQNAIVAFVLAIVSWVLCPIVAAIVALVFASKASKEIEQSGGWQTGSGFVTAAKVIAWINIVAMALFVVFYIVVIVIIIGAGTVTNFDVTTSPFPTPTGLSG